MVGGAPAPGGTPAPGGAKDAGDGGDAPKTITADEFDKLPPDEQEKYEPDGNGGYKLKEGN